MGSIRTRPSATPGRGTKEATDLDLLGRIRLGDESALERLYGRYGGLVYTLAMRVVGDPELAREVLQDTFIRSWDGRETYDAQRGRVPWWLMAIARNRGSNGGGGRRLLCAGGRPGLPSKASSYVALRVSAPMRPVRSSVTLDGRGSKRYGL